VRRCSIDTTDITTMYTTTYYYILFYLVSHSLTRHTIPGEEALYLAEVMNRSYKSPVF